MIDRILTLLRDIADIILPRHCCICGRRLKAEEEQLCIKCWALLPFTNIHGEQGNGIERIFWGKIPIVRANALIHYQANNYTILPILQLKYANNAEMGIYLGQCMAEDLIDSEFFTAIDYLVPIPISNSRLKKRGYNQSEMLAKGVSKITGIPIATDLIIRKTDNATQTRLTAQQREENVQNIFEIQRTEKIRGKHLLLIDDVITTGATILSCAQKLCEVEGVRISVLTAYVAGSHPKGISSHAKSQETYI